MTNIILFFRPYDDYGFMSNWYKSPFPLQFGDKIYQFENVEQAMMASKANLMGDQNMFEVILNESDPKRVKGLGRKVTNFNPDLWDKYKKQIVKAAITSKFKFNPNLREQLLATGDSYLAEGSPYDKIWGTGSTSRNPKYWKGQNLLGVILMEVRSEI